MIHPKLWPATDLLNLAFEDYRSISTLLDTLKTKFQELLSALLLAEVFLVPVNFDLRYAFELSAAIPRCFAP